MIHQEKSHFGERQYAWRSHRNVYGTWCSLKWGWCTSSRWLWKSSRTYQVRTNQVNGSRGISHVTIHWRFRAYGSRAKSNYQSGSLSKCVVRNQPRLWLVMTRKDVSSINTWAILVRATWAMRWFWRYIYSNYQWD